MTLQIRSLYPKLQVTDGDIWVPAVLDQGLAEYLQSFKSFSVLQDRKVAIESCHFEIIRSKDREAYCGLGIRLRILSMKILSMDDSENLRL
jgi:hypothetical protein